MAKGSLRARLAVNPGVAGFQLASRDPGDTLGLGRKRAEREIETSRPELLDLQTRLYAESRRSLLVVLQGMDTSGKDGTIKHVIGHFNPVDVRITNFKQPTPVERRHNFLWRIRPAVPGPGQIAIFNRSHYEDVLVARIDNLAPRREIERRYGEINGFEHELEDRGTRLFKICLHISWKEQGKRLYERLERPDKVWKFSERDLAVRAKWDDYQAAYDLALSRCSDPAPWHVVPADNKWFRDWSVTRLLLEELREMDPRYPAPIVDVKAMKAELKAQLRGV